MSDFYQQVEQVFHDWRYDHPKVLHGLIRSLKPLVVVESGSYRGYAASWMAKALQENNYGRLVCIDNWSLTDHLSRYQGVTARQHFEQNLEVLGVRGFVDIIEGDYDKVQWPQRIDFAYVDGWHSFKAAYHDFLKCADAGAECICFDDTTQSVGPRLLMQKIRESGQWDVIDVDRDCGLGICMRRKPLRPITYSQEIEDLLPGMDLSAASPAEQQEHFRQASERNGIDYASILPFLHEGRTSL